MISTVQIYVSILWRKKYDINKCYIQTIIMTKESTSVWVAQQCDMQVKPVQIRVVFPPTNASWSKDGAMMGVYICSKE